MYVLPNPESEFELFSLTVFHGLLENFDPKDRNRYFLGTQSDRTKTPTPYAYVSVANTPEEIERLTPKWGTPTIEVPIIKADEMAPSVFTLVRDDENILREIQFFYLDPSGKFNIAGFSVVLPDKDFPEIKIFFDPRVSNREIQSGTIEFQIRISQLSSLIEEVVKKDLLEKNTQAKTQESASINEEPASKENAEVLITDAVTRLTQGIDALSNTGKDFGGLGPVGY